MSEHFDAIVIGTGQGGSPLVSKLAESGRRTAVIERHLFGGTCVNVGCTPTKTYVASARVAHVARQAGEFGVTVGAEIGVDMARVKARKEKIIIASRESVERSLRSTPGVTVFNGHARFTGPCSVSVQESSGRHFALDAGSIFINTGTRPRVPPIEGIENVVYHTNSTILDLDELPTHLVIIGASYIALEFAQIFRRFGSRVTVLVRGHRILEREDADFATQIEQVLSREGVEFVFDADATRLDSISGGVRIRMKHDSVDASHLLFATGRIPNTDDLGLELAGITPDKQGLIPVDGQLRTHVSGIWALGDVNGRGAFTHTSYNDFEIIASDFLEGVVRNVDTRIMSYAVFVDPPFARVGMSEADVRRDGRKALIATMPMSRVGRARDRSETDGFMKVMVDATTNKILGAAICGIEADEAIHTFIDIMTSDQPYTTLQRAMHIHPTVSELVPTLLGGLRPLNF